MSIKLTEDIELISVVDGQVTEVRIGEFSDKVFRLNESEGEVNGARSEMEIMIDGKTLTEVLRSKKGD